jgi:hypothetical protein
MTTWTTDEYAAHLARKANQKAPAKAPAKTAAAAVKVSSVPTVPARAGRSHTPGVMNKTEAAWGLVLEGRRCAGEVSWYRFESMTLKLAHDCRYTPDFLVQLPDGTLELHEVKGFMRDDAAVKLKICAEVYPFKIWLVKRVAGAWSETTIGRAGGNTK